MQKYQDVVLNQNGNPVSGVQVTVTDLLGTPVSVYSANAIGLNVNPLTSDNNGRFSFYAPDGRYNLSFSFGGNVVASITDILLEDPMDGSDAVFNDVTILGGLSDASKITSTAAGGLSSTNVQAALEELDGEKIDASSLAAPGGAALVGSDDGASGSLWTTVDGFITKVMSSDGSSVVGFIQSGTGAVATTVQEALRRTVSVFNFMTAEQIADVRSGTASIDVTAAIQAALDSMFPAGGTLLFPKGIYLVSDHNADGSCLSVKCHITLLGEGAFCTAIKPVASLSATASVITFDPDPAYAADFSGVEKLFIGDLTTGARKGNHGIYCSTQIAGQYLPKFTVRDCYIAQGGGYAIYHLNTPANNVNGGMYAALISNNTLKGGVKLENSGDSIVIEKNILSGDGTGVHAALTTGASLLSIIDNNITTNKSAVILLAGMRVSILRNNIEHSAVGANSLSVIDIAATGGTYVAGVIQQNLISAFGSSDATELIHIRNARGTLIQDNTFLADIVGITALKISSTCVDVRVGANTFNAAIATKVNDSGIGTIGVKKNLTLLNSWVEQTVYDTPTVYKDLSGSVVIEGVIKNGTVTPGTKLFTLPLGFRPPATSVKRFNAYSVGAGGAEFGQFLIDEAGDVTIEDGGNTQFILSGAVFRAANAADAVSPE